MDGDRLATWADLAALEAREATERRRRRWAVEDERREAGQAKARTVTPRPAPKAPEPEPPDPDGVWFAGERVDGLFAPLPKPRKPEPPDTEPLLPADPDREQLTRYIPGIGTVLVGFEADEEPGWGTTYGT